MSEKARMPETVGDCLDRGGYLKVQDRAERMCIEKGAAELALARAQRRIHLLENSGAFRLGMALVHASRSLRGLVALPRALREVFRHLRRRGEQLSPDEPEERTTADLLGILPPSDYSTRLREPAPETPGQLRIAAVVDEFTEAGFAPECEFVNLEPTGFEDVLDAMKPHFLLVESCWRGKANGWLRKVHPVSGTLAHLIGCCRRRGIPTVFWNKEDPSHFDHFIDAARFFDRVFTTDAACVPRYKEALGHDRVHVLRFGCQPRIHNPVIGSQRRLAASFAGSWYAQYPERSRDLERLIEIVGRVMPVEIHDRNAERGDPKFAFPKHFASMMRGAVPYTQIHTAYKSCWFGININTIKNSPTMFARRVYELLASNTLVISNRSEGMELEFGDLVLSEAMPDFRDRLEQLHGSELERSRLQVAGLRKVLSAHTVQARLAELASIVLDVVCEPPQIHVVMLAKVRDPEQAADAIRIYASQRWQEKSLVLLLPSPPGATFARFAAPGITLLPPEDVFGVPALHAGGKERWIAPVDTADYYGPDYVGDLARATSYSTGLPVGKGKTFVWHEGEEPDVLEGVVHARTMLRPFSSLVPAAMVADEGGWAEMMKEGATIEGIATDAFNYCKKGGGQIVRDVVVA